VFAELCDAVEEVIELYKEDGKSLPPATIGVAGLLETMIDDLRPGDEDAFEAIPGDEAMDEARKRLRRDV
jgi:hypothetical protein